MQIHSHCKFYFNSNDRTFRIELKARDAMDVILWHIISVYMYLLVLLLCMKM